MSPLRDAGDVVRLVEADGWMMTALAHVAALGLPEWWIPAGFLRAKVWDALSGHETATRPGDIDVVFFDPSQPADEDRVLEAALRAAGPDYPWEVANQAHMHHYNGDAPYAGSIDAFSRWAETVSTVAVRLDAAGRVELAAPHGLDDLLAMVVRPTPHGDAKRDIFEKRLAAKNWRGRWPRLRVVREEGNTA